MVLLIIWYWPTQFLLRSVFKEGSTTRTCSRIELRNRVGQTRTVSHGCHGLEHDKVKNSDSFSPVWAISKIYLSRHHFIPLCPRTDRSLFMNSYQWNFQRWSCSRKIWSQTRNDDLMIIEWGIRSYYVLPKTEINELMVF